jgi:hypothetical protein
MASNNLEIGYKNIIGLLHIPRTTREGGVGWVERREFRNFVPLKSLDI